MTHPTEFNDPRRKVPKMTPEELERLKIDDPDLYEAIWSPEATDASKTAFCITHLTNFYERLNWYANESRDEIGRDEYGN